MTRYQSAIDTARSILTRADGTPPPKVLFPFFLAHRDACCFTCDRPLSDNAVSGHAPMRGAFRGDCDRCSCLTWYDCAEGGAELASTREARGEVDPPRGHPPTVSPERFEALIASARHWEALAREEQERASWNRQIGIDLSLAGQSAGDHKARTFRDVAKAQRAEAETGIAHCSCHQLPIAQCARLRG